MALEQKLSLKLAQKLVMTPSLQQAIKLLQMTRMELDTLLTQELVENPVLEESGDVAEDETPQAEEGAPPEPPANGEGLDHTQAMENIGLDAYCGEYWEGPGSSSMMEERAAPPIETSLPREADLYDLLLWRLNMAEVTPRQREIVELITGTLNPDGFL